MIKYCRRCMYPSNHALNLVFDGEGICSGCRVHEEKDRIDWSERWIELQELVGLFKNRNNTNYDCLIPVNGAKDSFFIVDTVVNKLELNPLLVYYNSQYNTPEGVRNLAKIRMEFGVDLFQKTVSPEVIKKITRSTLRKFGSIYWHVIAGETVYPVQMAVQLKIPLIIWGAHQGLDQSGMYSHYDYVEMSRKYRKDHDCMGVEAEDIVNEFDNITMQDVEPFKYPSNRDIERVGVRGIYLNNYIRWDSRTQHEKMVEKYGYEGRMQTRTFDSLMNADCYVYSDVHDYIKLIKHGYSKVNDQVAREIRLGHMSKKEGIREIEKYLLRKPIYLSMFLDWIGMSESGFWYLMDLHRNKRFWNRNERWEWVYTGKINSSEAIDNYDYPDKKHYSEYLETTKGKSDDITNKFILIGKGYAN